MLAKKLLVFFNLQGGISLVCRHCLHGWSVCVGIGNGLISLICRHCSRGWSVCVGIGTGLTKSLLSAGAVVYALDNSQQSLDQLVSEVLID